MPWELMALLRLYQLEATAFTGAVISSVVPPLNHALCGAVRKVTGVEPLLVGPRHQDRREYPH